MTVARVTYSDYAPDYNPHMDGMGDGADELEAAIDGVIAKVKADGVTSEEVTRAQNRLLKQAVFAQQAARAQSAAHCAA